MRMTAAPEDIACCRCEQAAVYLTDRLQMSLKIGDKTHNPVVQLAGDRWCEPCLRAHAVELAEAVASFQLGLAHTYHGIADEVSRGERHPIRCDMCQGPVTRWIYTGGQNQPVCQPCLYTARRNESLPFALQIPDETLRRLAILACFKVAQDSSSQAFQAIWAGYNEPARGISG